jgi:hypothetical protein
MGYKQNNMKFDFMETSFVDMDLNHLTQDSPTEGTHVSNTHLDSISQN